jgi:glucose/arabinose dehydrogenase
MKHLMPWLILAVLTACNAPSDADGSDAADGAATAESAMEAQDGGNGDGAAESSAGDATAGRASEETRPREAPELEPAFEGQTRAPVPAETTGWQVETVAEGLTHPWAIAFLPDGSMLVTERPGELRHVASDGTVSEPLAGVPEVDNRNQGGLLDVALAPDFESSRVIFFSFSEPRGNGTNTTSLARARLSEDHSGLSAVEVIFRQQPAVESTGHFGSRIVFEDEDTLWLAMGDRQGHPVRRNAQDPTNHIGTVVRIHTDGSVPEDNPFVDHPENRPEIWSFGHRNIQAAARHPEAGNLWTIEHGPRGGDELNQPEAGRNYGWPTIGYGIEYRGGKVYEGLTAQEGMEQPVYFWDPVIAPSGMDFYTGELFEEWQGDLFVGGLRGRKVVRLVVDAEAERVLAEEWLEIGQRVRDVTTGPDGAIYLVTDHDDGQVLRIVPAEERAGDS